LVSRPGRLRAGQSPLWRCSLEGAALLARCPLLRCCQLPSPSSPHPTPSELPGFIVILLGVFIEKTVLGLL
jgi:hypothetical protein